MSKQLRQFADKTGYTVSTGFPIIRSVQATPQSFQKIPGSPKTFFGCPKKCSDFQRLWMSTQGFRGQNIFAWPSTCLDSEAFLWSSESFFFVHQKIVWTFKNILKTKQFIGRPNICSMCANICLGT